MAASTSLSSSSAYQASLPELKKTLGKIRKQFTQERKICEEADRIEHLAEKIFLKGTARGVDPDAFIKELCERVSALSSNPTLIEEHIKRIRVDIEGNYWVSLANRVKYINLGKAKKIWVRGREESAKHVYSTPRVYKGLFGRIRTAWKKAELKGEFQVAKLIREKLQGEQINPCEHLAVDFEEVEEPEKVKGRYTLKSLKALGDLETMLVPPEESSIGSYDRRLFSFGSQILKGVRDLHRAGFLHGDLKLANLLYYDGDVVKLADLGKARRIPPHGGTCFYSGNPRFAAPEWKLSERSEVFCAGAMLIKVLENQFLSDSQPMLVDLTERKRIVASENRRGIERFLVSNKRCPQTENVSPWGKAMVIAKGLASLFRTKGRGPLSGADRVKFNAEIERYIDALIEKMGGCRPALDRDKLLELRTLLVAMMKADPAERPTIEQASGQYEEIFKAFK